MCADRQTRTKLASSMRQVRKDGAMPQTVLLNHDDRAKAETVQDAPLNLLSEFFIAGSCESFCLSP
jgi:hypothetical protein